MFTKAIVLLVCLCIFKGIKSSTIVVNDNTTLTIKGTILSSETINLRSIHKISVSPYENGVQIDKVANLTDLKSFLMLGTGQYHIPVFENVPKLREIRLTRNQLIFIMRESFSSIGVQNLDLSFSGIRIIQDKSFGMNVTGVYLNCNKLINIEVSWFQNPAILESLNVGGNKIRNIPERLFENFTSLGHIALHHNQIHTIGDGAFGNRNCIYYLSLGCNVIKELTPTIFNRDKQIIGMLDIEYNQLTFLSENFLKTVTLILTPRIQGNPWQCTCYQKIIKWMPWDSYKLTTPQDIPGEPRCVTSKNPEKYFECVTEIDDNTEELINTFNLATTPVNNTMVDYCECSGNTKKCHTHAQMFGYKH